ncbi:MAG: histone [Rhabdochlamydiaceae bacterium]
MSLKDTVSDLKILLNNITVDLEKAEKGNKAAAQRVRTQSVKFAKVAKVYRKESIVSEKKGAHKKAASKAVAKHKIKPKVVAKAKTVVKKAKVKR